MHFIKINLAAMGLIMAQSAFGGVGSSGGGNAVVCRTTEGEIQFARLLDLFEAEARGVTLLAPKLSLTAEYRRMLKNLRDSLNNDVEPTIEDEINFEQTISKFNYVDEELEQLGDIGETVELPESCTIEQLAIYEDDTHDVRVSREIWSHLDPMSKVGLYAHELIYREYRRKFHVPVSEEVRKMVGRLFSSSHPLTRIDEGFSEAAQECHTSLQHWPKDSVFYMEVDRARPSVRHIRINVLEGVDLFHPIDVTYDLDAFEGPRLIASGPLKGNFISIDFDPRTQHPTTLAYIPEDWEQHPARTYVLRGNCQSI